MGLAEPACLSSSTRRSNFQAEVEHTRSTRLRASIIATSCSLPPSVRYGGRFLSDTGARCPRDPLGTRQPTRSTEPLRPRSSLLGTELSHLKLRQNSDQTQVHSPRTTRMVIATRTGHPGSPRGDFHPRPVIFIAGSPPSPGKSPLETPRPGESHHVRRRVRELLV